MKHASTKPAGLALMTAVFTVVLFMFVFTVIGRGQQDLAARVDRNARLGRETAEIAQRSARSADRTALENRYVSLCSLFTPPFPERTINDLVVCIEEAEMMPLKANLGAYLKRNLKARDVKEGPEVESATTEDPEASPTSTPAPTSTPEPEPPPPPEPSGEPTPPPDDDGGDGCILIVCVDTEVSPA